MSTNLVNKDTGELVTLANGTRMWIGTKTAHDLAVQQGTMPNNCMVCITDDYPGSTMPRFPDYAHPISIPATNSWTVTEDCYVIFHWITLGGGKNALYLDGNRVDVWDGSTQSDVIAYSISFSGYLKKGQVVSLASGFNFSSNSIKVYPLVNN